MSRDTMSLDAALETLEKVAPGAPFLALGQTVFWDEPMKAGVALRSRRLGYDRPFVAGVHDTDYFAKLPSGRRDARQYLALPHNDTTTRGLWSAAGEFSALFGSETVVTRHDLLEGGLKFDKLAGRRPDFLDCATEAWGWRGIVSLEDNPPISAELPLRGVFPVLKETLDWAVRESLACLTGEGALASRQLAYQLETLVCDAYDDLISANPNASLADLYRRLIPSLYSFAANAHVAPTTTTTSELLAFNTESAQRPRFELVQFFLDPATRDQAKACYDEVVQGTGQYELARFGAGAIPFDLVIPGRGRGALRLGRRGLVVMTPEPAFATLKRPITSVTELAEVVERKWGEKCVLVGKAITLIGMLAREFVFVFHESASAYVKQSRRLHECLGKMSGRPLPLHPILRVRYDIWDALRVCCSWIKLPAPLEGPFGTEELCAPSVAHRWQEVGSRQEALFAELGKLRRPLDLLGFLERELGGSWQKLADEYESLHRQLEEATSELVRARTSRVALYDRRRILRRERTELELAVGRHFRERIFEREPLSEDLEHRRQSLAKLDAIIDRARANEAALRASMRAQRDHAQRDEVLRLHERRRAIELEAELARLRLIRGAIIASRGLRHASHRPSAWWFRLVCPDGLWFHETIESAQCYLEPLA